MMPTLRAISRRAALSLVGLSAIPQTGPSAPPSDACSAESCSPEEPTIDSPHDGPLDVVLTVEPTATGGGGLTFVVTATNRLTSPLLLTFRNGQWSDVTVVAADGAPIWRWATGRVFTQAIREVTLAPGQAREVRLEWPQANLALTSELAPWTASATWVSDPGGTSPPIAFGPDWPEPPAGDASRP